MECASTASEEDLHMVYMCVCVGVVYAYNVCVCVLFK